MENRAFLVVDEFKNVSLFLVKYLCVCYNEQMNSSHSSSSSDTSSHGGGDSVSKTSATSPQNQNPVWLQKDPSGGGSSSSKPAKTHVSDKKTSSPKAQKPVSKKNDTPHPQHTKKQTASPKSNHSSDKAHKHRPSQKNTQKSPSHHAQQPSSDDSLSSTMVRFESRSAAPQSKPASQKTPPSSPTVALTTKPKSKPVSTATKEETNPFDAAPQKESSPDEIQKKSSSQKKQTPSTEDIVDIDVKKKDDDIPLDMDDESLVVENDGDFFWLLQRAIWMIVKILIVFGIIGFVVWVVWRGDDTDERRITDFLSFQKNDSIEKPSEDLDLPVSPEKTVDQKTSQNDDPQETPSSLTDSVKNIFSPVLSNSSEDTISPSSFVDDIDVYVRYVVRARYFLQTQLDTTTWGSDVTVRSQKMETFLRALYDLIVESSTLRKRLMVKIDAYQKGMDQYNTLIGYHSQQLNESLMQLQPEKSSLHLTHKTNALQNYQTHASLYESNRYILHVMELYDQSLRQVYHKALSNKKAIVHNIQVVYFDVDPFKRVLIPAEIRGQ